MAGNNSIQFLRGTRNAIAESSEKLLPGQPLYNVDDNYLTIGGNANDQVNSIPIACRELKGYVTDLSDQINSVTGTTEQWSIKYEKGKGIQFDNDVQYQGNDITLPDKSAGTKNGDVIPGAKTLGIQAAAFGGLKYTHVNESEGNWGRTPTSAEGDQSFAFGGSTHAYGDWSFAGGKDTKAYQRATVALGGGSKAGRSEEEFNDFFYKDGAPSNGGKGRSSPNGPILDSEGKPYLESNSYAVSFGELNDAYGRASFASGSCNSVADYGFAAGKYLIADYEQIAFGKYNSAGFTSNDSTRTIFSIGNGTADKDRSNALELTRNCMFKVGKNNSFSNQWNNGCMLFGQNITSSLEDNFGFYFGNNLKSKVHYYQPHLVIGSGEPKNISDNYFYSLSVFNGGSSPVFGVQPNGKVYTDCIQTYGIETNIINNYTSFNSGIIVAGQLETNSNAIIKGNIDNEQGYFSTKGITVLPTESTCKLTFGSNGSGVSSIASRCDNGLHIKSLKLNDYTSSPLMLTNCQLTVSSDNKTNYFILQDNKFSYTNTSNYGVELKENNIRISAGITQQLCDGCSNTFEGISHFTNKVYVDYKPKQATDVVRLMDLDPYVKVETKDDWILCGGPTGGSGSTYQAVYNNKFVLSTDPAVYNGSMGLTTHKSVIVTLNKSYKISKVYTGGHTAGTTCVGPTVLSWNVSDNKLTINYNRSPKNDDDFYVRIVYTDTNYDIGGVGGGCNCPDIQIVAKSPSTPVNNTIYFITA